MSIFTSLFLLLFKTIEIIEFPYTVQKDIINKKLSEKIHLFYGDKLFHEKFSLKLMGHCFKMIVEAETVTHFQITHKNTMFQNVHFQSSFSYFVQDY